MGPRTDTHSDTPVVGWRDPCGTRGVELACRTWRLTISRVPLTGSALVEAYDRASGRWSRSQRAFGYSHAYSELWGQVASEFGLNQLRPGARVLDCGTGTGALARALPKDLAARARLYAIDRARRMLARAHAELDRAERTARLYQADAQCLPFSDGVFDVVMSAHMLEHLTDPEAGLEEILRVLRSHGVILLVTTRANTLEATLRLAWRYCTLEPTWIHNCLRRMGITRLHTYRIGQSRHLARWLSLAHVGIKK